MYISKSPLPNPDGPSSLNNIMVVRDSRGCQGKLWLPKSAPWKNNFNTMLSQKLYWYDLAKARNQFKKPKDMSGVELSYFENF